MLPRFIPRKCARGSINTDQDVTLYSTAMLYNNSSGRDLLVIRDFQPNSGGISNGSGLFDLNMRYVQGHSGTLGGVITPLVPGDATPPGELYADLVASPLSASDYVMGGGLETNSAWYHDFPFAILLPGWSFQITLSPNNIAFSAAFWWQYCTPTELDGTQEDFVLERLRETFG